TSRAACGCPVASPSRSTTTSAPTGVIWDESPHEALLLRRRPTNNFAGTPMSTSFREKNPVVIGAVSLAVIALLILAAFRAQDLPVIGGGDTYSAAFSEAGGLKPNDEVRIAGVRVGKVEKVELEGDHVKVTFRVDTDSEFGDEPHAAIKVKT